MTIHECKEHGAGPCLNENLIGEIAEANATLANRIAALEAQVEAAHRAIDSIGLSRCADAHAGVYPDGRITCDDGRPPLSLVDRVEWLIRWLSDDPYPMGPRIKALEAENAALKAERDAIKARDTEARDALEQVHTMLSAAGIDAGHVVYRLNALINARDAAESRVRVLEAQLSKAHRKIANQRDANRRLTEDAHRRKAELTAMKSVAHTEARNWTLTANRLIAARQSRARLVWLVRAKNGEFNHLMKLWGEARAWAAAWKRAAKRWQNELLTPRTVTFRVEKDLSQSSIDRRSQRRAERITSNRRAAEAMDRR